MSRCKACDSIMTSFELTRKYAESGAYVDLCNHCFGTIAHEVPVIERPDLLHDTLEVEDE